MLANCGIPEQSLALSGTERGGPDGFVLLTPGRPAFAVGHPGDPTTRAGSPSAAACS
jgi:hypothetical protein